jgi:nucleoid DNA-binding protein
MGKKEIIDNAILNPLIAHLPKKFLKRALDTYLRSIIYLLHQSSHLEIRGFGTFTIAEVPARNAHNPRTGQPVFIPAHRRVKFRPGKDFREALREGNGNGESILDA